MDKVKMSNDFLLMSEYQSGPPNFSQNVHHVSRNDEGGKGSCEGTSIKLLFRSPTTRNAYFPSCP